MSAEREQRLGKRYSKDDERPSRYCEYAVSLVVRNDSLVAEGSRFALICGRDSPAVPANHLISPGGSGKSPQCYHA
jgi:hypothetical protein